MKIAVNYRGTLFKLVEGLRELGHEVVENVWDVHRYRNEGIEALVIEFPTVFNKKWQSIPLIWQLRTAGIPVATWNVDAPWHMKGLNRFRLPPLLALRFFSVYATHSLQNTSWIRGTQVLYLPNAAWTRNYHLNGHTIEEICDKSDYRYDVSFIGNLSSDRFPEHRRRVAFLKELEQFLKAEGLKYFFADSFCINLSLSHAEQIDIIQNSRINLSCIAATDSTGIPSWGLTERCFGVPASGGFLLMEDRVHVKDCFDVATEVASYNGLDDCKAKILYFLANDEERRRILVQAHDRVMREHTYKQRALALTEALHQKCRL